MKRSLTILLALILIVSLSVPAFAEPQYVTTIYSQPEKDEAYWEKLFEREKEQDWEVNGLPEYTGPAADVPDPTPEQITQWKEQAQKRLEEEKENDMVNMSLESEKNTKMMGLVFGDKQNDHSDVPDSSFSGEYQEFTGADGSSTRVYEDGSIDTKYPDGSWEGLDKLGNHYTEDKSGSRTISFVNGDVGSFGEDGSLSIKQTDGSTVTYHPDDTVSWTNDTGLVIRYDEYGTYQSIGFEGGETVDLVHGQFPPGDQKITGPNGAYIEWHNGNDAQLSEDGTHVVNGDGQYGFTVKGTNGATGKLSSEGEFNPRIDEAASIAEKQKTNGKRGDIYTSDTRYDISTMGGGGCEILINNNDSDKISVTYEDPDGNVYTDKNLGGGMHETSYESADGKTGFHASLDENGLNVTGKENGVEHKVAETVQNEDGTVSIKFDNGASLTMDGEGGASLDLGNGKRITLDKDGNPKELTGGGDSIAWDDEGNVISAHLTAEDGSVLTVDGDTASVTLPDGGSYVVTTNADGVRTATFPDGSVRTKDAYGNWLTEGETADAEGNIYDKDGNLVKGAHDAEGFDDPSKRAEPDTPGADVPAAETPADAPSTDGFTGGYYGTYDYTAYWDGGKQKQGDRAYYVYEYNGCYYLVQTNTPDDVKALIQQYGIDDFFHGYYDGEDLVVEGSSFDPAAKTGTYVERSYLNDVQYISTAYTITFDGSGGITVSWESQNVYKGTATPQESGIFTGSRK